MANRPVRSYKDLLVWQRGIELVEAVYEVTKGFPSSELYGLTAQIRRSAVSVPSNLAEGQARQHTGEFRQFLYVALGSLAELSTQLAIADRLGHLARDSREEVDDLVREVRKMIHGLLSKLPKDD
jgi:four helix bundle protein